MLGTGWFGAVAAEVGPGKTVAVVGDGAVGLLGVLAARQLGAERIIIMSRHESRQQLAREFGATDIIEERGDDGVARIKDLTDGLGVHSVIEAVGTRESMLQAIGSVRPGGHVGYVGVTHGDLPGDQLFFSHAHLHGGPAPVRRFLPELIDLISNRTIDPGKVFDLTLPARPGRRRLPGDGRTTRHQDPPHRLTRPPEGTLHHEPRLRLLRPGRPRHRRQLRHGPRHRPSLRRSRRRRRARRPPRTRTPRRRRRPRKPPGIRCSPSPATSPTRTQVAAMVDRTVATFGRLDMAFNNAGIQAPPTDAADEPADLFDRVNAVNLRGVWASMKHELRHMRDQGAGAIVNCSSLGGLVGLPGRAAYHASKHGVIGLTRSAALEYAPRGIRINAICPGTFDTPMVADMIASGELDEATAIANQPIGRLGRADEIAATVLWLCSPGASFVVGVALPVDGGYTAQ